MWRKLVTLLIAIGASAVSAQRGELQAVMLLRRMKTEDEVHRSVCF